MIARGIFHLKRLWWALRDWIIVQRIICQIPKIVPSKRRRLLFIMADTGIGGIQKVCLDIVSSLDAEQYAIAILTTNQNVHHWEQRFRSVVEYLWLLPAVTEKRKYFPIIETVVRRLRIELICITHSRIGYACIPLLRQRFLTLKIVDLLHNREWQKRKNLEMIEYAHQFDSWIDRRIVVNHDVERYLIECYHTDPQKVTVIHNGVDVTLFDPSTVPAGIYRTHYQIKESERIISFIGRLSPEKRPDMVIELAEWFRQRGHQNIRIFLAGNGREHGALQEKIAQSGCQTMVIMTGAIDDSHALLQDTDILFLCSEMEGLPIVVLEALAMQVPIIAPCVGGIPELVIDGENGYLIPFDQNFIDVCGQKILMLLSDEMRYNHMAQNNRQRAEKYFSLSKMTADYDAVFQELLHQ